ncbi:MFS transporter [Vulcanisaeta distributa]|uniref:Major facilitator superfamily MFS_1 n=1 Tax=Vulcanisaeta distributa (strain DSM 14429 / JCM 11212 / NBRC 100878 / IC-017) TaxID=572478 RepID=E1QVA9_VULDI|nr:MFS transporter [Vulcanisaeta distributa]ADN50036.1 major facilitator superfamily MFS_1 [Vulcanisaeta distributa DSM 14429]
MHRSVYLILIVKGLRTFVFGMVSVLTPIYLAMLGFSPTYVGASIFLVVLGNVFSNVLLTWFGNVIGRRRLLIIFSLLIFISGILLSSSSLYPVLALALFMGNISTTGTEAGPFQSIEVGVLPRFTGNRLGRVLGLYNLIGYSASSLGALASSLPAYLGDKLVFVRSMYLIYAVVGLVMVIAYSALGNIEGGGRRLGLRGLGRTAVADIRNLSMLFSVDAFGGGLVTQSLLSYWFYIRYGVTLRELGLVFMVVNVVTAISLVIAPLIAERIGNLRTMVYTHIISNIFLILIPLAGSFTGSLAFLLLRQSVSQMDVPTRQAFMAQIFSDEERVPANAVTNTARSIGSLPGPLIVGDLISQGLYSLPFIISGSLKIMYDLTIYLMYRGRVVK